MIFAVALASLGAASYVLHHKSDATTPAPTEADGKVQPDEPNDAWLDAQAEKYHGAANCTTENLWQWLDKNGAVHKDLKTGKFIVQDNGKDDEEYEKLIHKERGVYTQIGLKSGDEILRIPNSILLDQDKFLASPLKLVGEMYSNLNQFDYLALLLLHERAKGYDSKWYPYLCTLPTYALYKRIFPFFWTARKLRGTSEKVQLWVKQARFNLNQKYNMMFPFLSEKYPDLFPARLYRIQDFSWVYFVVMSRNWSVKKDERDVNVLVPLADMLNHDEDSAYVQYPKTIAEQRDIFFALIAKRGYNPGEQVYDVYGAVCNDYNLVMYGFTQPSNTRECTEMPWNFQF